MDIKNLEQLKEANSWAVKTVSRNTEKEATEVFNNWVDSLDKVLDEEYFLDIAKAIVMIKDKERQAYNNIKQ
ncbi:hypothetical protein [Salsuginibacillus kocurii]|uniref:hypothetical protein n=1 Tax=Salsuginibacillus kocurii TaxID=427078 RepID=UPI000369F36A|nr:hypothetical protein [Salsuginibacillus kocurii]